MRDEIAKFIFQAGQMARTPRSGFSFLGQGEQSVGQHVFRTMVIAYSLLKMRDEKVDELHLLNMLLFHDFFEAKTGDLNWVNHRYLRMDVDKLVDELSKEISFGLDIAKLIEEFEKSETIEAQIANDADQLEFIAALKEQSVLGHSTALEWVPPILQRLKTKEATELAQTLLSGRVDTWWFADRNDRHWIDRT